MESNAAAVSTQQALEALREVERAQYRSSIFRGYEYGAPHFLLWGVIWVVGFACSDFFPSRNGPVWLGLDLAGIAGSLLIVRARRGGMTRHATMKRLAMAVAITAFMVATYYVLRPRSDAQFGAFPALVMALAYVLVGIIRGGLRWTVVGIAVAGLTLLGYGFLRQNFMLWMAVVGGSTLLSTGLWMRRA